MKVFIDLTSIFLENKLQNSELKNDQKDQIEKA